MGTGGKIDCNSECRQSDKNCGFNIDQEILAKMNYINDVSSNTANNLVTQLQADISNKASQTASIIRGFLSNIGSNNKDEMAVNITTRISQIISNTITTQNLTKEVNQSLIYQNQELIVNGTISGNGCFFNQKTQVNTIAKNISSNLVNNVVKDKTINRIVNDATQTLTKKEKGLYLTII